jgi:hypothetical protein
MKATLADHMTLVPSASSVFVVCLVTVELALAFFLHVSLHDNLLSTTSYDHIHFTQTQWAFLKNFYPLEAGGARSAVPR